MSCLTNPPKSHERTTFSNNILSFIFIVFPAVARYCGPYFLCISSTRISCI